MTPDASQYNPDPKYMADLIESTGLNQEALGELIGYGSRTIRSWVADPKAPGFRTYPYSAQFAIECLVFQV